MKQPLLSLMKTQKLFSLVSDENSKIVFSYEEYD